MPSVKDRYSSIFLAVAVAFSASASISVLLSLSAPAPVFAGEAATLYERGLALAGAGDQKGAIELYGQAIKLAPGDGKSYGYRAYAYYKLLDGPHALADATKALSLGFDTSYVRMARGAALYWADRVAESIPEFDAALRLNPGEYAAYSWRAIAKMSLAELSAALADANTAVAMRPSDPDLYEMRADVLEIVGDEAQLLSDYKTILALTAGSNADTPTRACALIGIGSPAEGLEMIDRILAKGPNDYCFLLKGRALLALGRFQDALPFLDKYLAINPDFARAHYYKGLCYKGLNKDSDAILALARALKVIPSFARAKAQLDLLTKSSPSAATPSPVPNSIPNPVLNSVLNPINTLSSGSGPSSTPANSLSAKSKPVDDKWALVIGISQFANPKINLKCPAQDAKDFYNFLVGKAGFAKDHVKLLTDAQATRAAILSAIGDKWLPRLAHPNDLVIIYVSTHGSPSEIDLGSVNYLIAHDTDVDSLYATGIPLQDLVRIVKKRVLASRIVLILDACHSGAADPQAKALSRSFNVNVVEVAQGTGQLVLSSSAQDQQAWESKGGLNSVFTKRLLEGLQVNGTKTTLSECFEYLKEKVPDDVLRERGKVQTPVLRSDWSGDEAVIAAPALKPRSGLLDN